MHEFVMKKMCELCEYGGFNQEIVLQHFYNEAYIFCCVLLCCVVEFRNFLGNHINQSSVTPQSELIK
jgi:hypothetical protein